MEVSTRSVRLPRIESREHLLSVLAEASELEHNLMCLYLYAVFSLKQSTAENVSEHELERILSWRKAILSVAIEEMAHLSLVANLTTAIGGTVHFHRPDFPVTPGYYPSGFVIELAPFGLKSLDHFIFLERPQESETEKDDQHILEGEDSQVKPLRKIMVFPGDYKTVGELYHAIKNGIDHLCETIGEQQLFCGSASLQLTAEDIDLEGMISIKDRTTAFAAINTIVEQGEGASAPSGSHFEKFNNVKDEYLKLLLLNADFIPSRPAARNPAMRKPLNPAHRE